MQKNGVCQSKANPRVSWLDGSNLYFHLSTPSGGVNPMWNAKAQIPESHILYT